MNDDLDFGVKAGIPDPAQAGVGPATPLSDRDSIAGASARKGEDEFDRALRPTSLGEFVGQQRVCEQLEVYVDAALQRDEALDHALFAGPPGLGKCVTPDTMLFTSHGMVPIGELGDLDGDSWQPITKPMATLYGMRTADYFYNNGDGPTLKITTQRGFRVEGTPNHPLLVRDNQGRLQFRRLGELRIGDEVAVRLGAQVFGKSTQLHIEGVGMPTLSDAVNVPDELTPGLARLLGLAINCGRLSPGGDGVVFTSTESERLDEIERIMRTDMCASLEQFGEGPMGARRGIRSPRFARLFAGLGFSRDGIDGIPSPIYRAPRLVIAEFLQGIFWGHEHAPVFVHKDRTIIAHLQMMLVNFGIECAVAPDARGWAIRASADPSEFDTYNSDELAHLGEHDPEVEQPHDQLPSDAAARAQTMARSANVEPSSQPVSSTSSRSDVGFGMTAAGVLVAMGDDSSSYRRGQRWVDDIVPVPAANIGSATGEIGAYDQEQATTVTVAEVEPLERGRALTRGSSIAHDVRALAVRSVRSTLQSDEMVELMWEPVTSIEPGHAHTVDVSVPDGHTFVGNAIVCHNTTLANVVAHELGSTMHTTSGPALEKKADVAAILTSLGPRDVLFIDEIHRMSTAIEEVLYTAMEDYQIDIVLGQGPAARTMRIELEPFTLVGATTRTGLLTTPLRDRFGITQRLEYYNDDELTSIVHRSAKLTSLEIDAEAASEIASRSRGTPRIANRLLRRVRDVAQVRHQGAVTLDIAQEALDLVDIDAIGLDRTDRQLLEAILTKFGGGPVGLNTLSVAVGEEPNTIEDVYEPYLLQRGFLQRTPRGRIITELGRQHLGAAGYEVARGGELF